MKKKILTAIQVLVTLGILAWIFHDPQKRRDMAQALSNAQPLWFVLGILAYGVVEVLAAARWWILLNVQGIRIGGFRIVSLLMIGIFFNQFMPGGTGGDVVKIFYLLKETPGKKAQALLAVLIDRVVGLLGLIVVAGIVIGLRWGWLTQGKPIPHFDPALLFSIHGMKEWLGQIPLTAKLLYTLLLILIASIVGVASSFLISSLGLIHKLPQRMPFRDRLVELAVAYNLYGHAWKSSLAAVFASLGVHLASFYVFYAAARSISIQVPITNFFAVMPVINTIAALPISVGGTGVREGLFQTMLSSLCGIKEGDAVLISLIGFVMILAWAVVGGVIYLFYRPSEHAKIRDIQTEVRKLEHEIAESE